MLLPTTSALIISFELPPIIRRLDASVSRSAHYVSVLDAKTIPLFRFFLLLSSLCGHCCGEKISCLLYAMVVISIDLAQNCIINFFHCSFILHGMVGSLPGAENGY